MKLLQVKHINYTSPVKKKQIVKILKTGNEVLDHFISEAGGFVTGSAIFLTGTPGAGKTTLAYMIQKLLEGYKTSLYSREMSKDSVMEQMQRYEIKHKNAFITDRSMYKNIEEYIKDLDIFMPSLVIIDSLQIILEEDFANSPPEKSAFNIIQSLRDWTDKNSAVLIVIGHVNKDGSFEGKNTIEHLFDAHLEMIFNKVKSTRILSWTKNRKGPIEDVLYYVFGKETIEFYTKEQYQRMKDGKKLEDFIFESIISYMKSLNRTCPNYKIFRSEIRKEIDSIMKEKLRIIDSSLKCIKIIEKKARKYNM